MYNQVFICKNNSTIPLFSTGKSIESKYNPLAEAEKKLSVTNITSNIIIIFGIGSGIFVDLLSTKYSDKVFLAVEHSKNDIDFLKQFDSFKNLQSKKNVIILSENELFIKLPQIYIPSLYGNIQIIEQRPWIDENPENYSVLVLKLNESLKTIAADFSVQSHFGKIWQSNISKNILNLTEYANKFDYAYDNSKTAYIIAAGPSLDSKIEDLKKDKNAFIISTDTGFQTLMKNHIIPDIVVSIDGQNISYNHFINCQNCNKTLFIFDICGNSSAVEKLFENNKKVFFINNGHPFVNYINLFNKNCIPIINSGSGTVTIAAFDIAVKMGFSNINIIGADFSYLNGKAYAKGTYLDSLYYKTSNHIKTLENLFNKLQFRTELIHINKNHFTTEILDSYKKSFLKYITDIDCSVIRDNSIYKVHNNTKIKEKISFSNQSINYFKVIDDLIKEYNKVDISNTFIMDLLKENVILSLLPYISYLRTKNFLNLEASNENSLIEFSKLALKNIVRYNRTL